MSVEAKKLVEEKSLAKGSARSVLNELAWSAAPGGLLAWPKNQTLCARTGLSERAVQNALRRLERLGEIHRQPARETARRQRVYLVDPRPGVQMSLLETVSNGTGRAHIMRGAGSAGADPAVSGADFVGVGAAPLLRGRAREQVEIERTASPPAPPVGGSSHPGRSHRQGVAADRRRRRRRARGQAPLPPVACPLDQSAPNRILEEQQAVMRARLREAVDATEWELWLDRSHLHPVDGDQVELSVALGQSGWIRRRFGRLLNTVAGRPVTVVECDALGARR